MVFGNEIHYFSITIFNVWKLLVFNYIPKTFLEMYDEDQIGGIIRNVEFWLQDVFEQFKK